MYNIYDEKVLMLKNNLKIELLIVILRYIDFYFKLYDFYLKFIEFNFKVY